MNDEFEEDLYTGYEFEGEEDYFLESPPEQDESVYGIDPSDWGRVNFSQYEGGFGMGMYKSRDARSVSLAGVYMSLDGSEYRNFSKELIEEAMNKVKILPEEKLLVLSAELTAAAFLFYSKYKRLSKANVSSFIGDTDGLKHINHLDFIRYLRMFE